VKDNRPKIKTSTYCRSSDGDCSFTVSNLTRKEFDAIESFLNGQSYIRTVNGRLHAYCVNDPLPSPEEDPLVGDRWSYEGEPKQFGGIQCYEGWHNPGIVITHVGAGGPLSPERSKKHLMDCGFVCLRSPRNADGRFWEQWVLYSLCFAKGRLQEHMKEWKVRQTIDSRGAPWDKEIEEAARFIARDLQVSFGTMDITIQRWALACPD